MTRADVAVYSPEGNLQLVVEIKNRSGASAEWVIQMRRNLRVHAIIPPSPYFLLVLPDFFYLWTDAVSVPDLAPPAYQMKAAEVLAPYLDQSAQSLTDLSEYSLELLVTSWLEDLIGQTSDEIRLVHICNGSSTQDCTKPSLMALSRLKRPHDCVCRIEFCS